VPQGHDQISLLFSPTRDVTSRKIVFGQELVHGSQCTTHTGNLCDATCSFVSVYHDEPAMCGAASTLSAAALPDVAGSCPKWLQREIDQVWPKYLFFSPSKECCTLIFLSTKQICFHLFARNKDNTSTLLIYLSNTPRPYGISIFLPIQIHQHQFSCWAPSFYSKPPHSPHPRFPTLPCSERERIENVVLHYHFLLKYFFSSTLPLFLLQYLFSAPSATSFR